MILSMTGFGKAEDYYENCRYVCEIRSVNSRFCEISFKYPKCLSQRELDLKELIRQKISRGKIHVLIQRDSDGEKAVLNINSANLKEYLRLLKTLRRLIGSKEKIKLEHILRFSDIMTAEITEGIEDEEYKFVCQLVNITLEQLIQMKKREGDFLKKDIYQRLDRIENILETILQMASHRVQKEREKIENRINALIQDRSIIEERRLELEIVLLAEKLDFTEEITRLKSHLQYFREYAESEEYAGRRLNFLLQEMNREINTIAAKANDSTVSQLSTEVKEELEKIREQIQNVE
ncbi:MAG: YicC/YloC family endoribonuclease [Ignavibacteria bacterium]